MVLLLEQKLFEHRCSDGVTVSTSQGPSAMLSICHKCKMAAEFNLRYPDDNTLTELLAWAETEIELDF